MGFDRFKHKTDPNDQQPRMTIRSVLGATVLLNLDRASKIGGCLLLVSLGPSNPDLYLGILRDITSVNWREEGITHE